MSRLTYGAIDLAASAEEARRFDRMSNICHRGQDLAWDGRRVLDDLCAKHGDRSMAPPAPVPPPSKA